MSRLRIVEKQNISDVTGGKITAGAGTERNTNRSFGIGLARAFGGAILFSLPLLMTMEMWHLGFYMDRFRLALFLILAIPMLALLSYYAGFEETFNWKEDVLDAFGAYAVGFITSAFMLFLFAVIEVGMTADEIIGKISLQAIPAAIGAMLARSQLGDDKAEDRGDGPSAQYGGEIFLMAVGALFLAFNVAPTEEMILIAYRMTEWHAAALMIVSLTIMHAFVYAVEFRGQEASIPPGTPFWSVFLRFTVVGYAVALLISLYVLWTFGRTEGTSVEEIMITTVVLGFPAALGAAVARLIL